MDKVDMKIELMKENEIDETCEMILRACRCSEFARFYPNKYITCSREALKQKAEMGHFYVVKDNGKIIGCGGIGPYWGSKTESWIFTIAVDPDYQKKGIGTKIIDFLENDEYAKRASRLEVHAGISAIPFYRKLGYEHKNGDLCYKDGHFDLEKFF